MKYGKTTAVSKILKMKKRLKVIQGGASAGKTIAVLLIIIDRAMCENGKLFSIVSESFPHLKRGALRDFMNIMQGHNYYNEDEWNRTDYIYTFKNGSRIEFFSADQPSKVRGPRRDVLFLNEVNNIPYETFTQLAIRTNEDIYVDYNPVAEFYMHTDVMKQQEHDFIILTYKDNEGLPETIIKELESRKENKNFWQVYGLGQLGEVEGKIFRDWQIIDELPHEARLLRRGLDFGWNDPAAIVDVYKLNDGYIVDEVYYGRETSNRKLADVILNHDNTVITVADSAEPKSIDEMKEYGVNVMGCTKGPGSVMARIKNVQDKRMSVTKRSVNVIREYRNYLWKTDRDGKILDEPEHEFSHSLDALTYALEGVFVTSIMDQMKPLKKKQRVKLTKFG